MATSGNPAAKAKVETSSEDWDDVLLLTAISDSKAGVAQKQVADDAFRIFHRRWEVRVDRLVELMCRFPPASMIGIDTVTAELWFRVFSGAATFTDGGLSGESLTRRTFKWLKQIAKNALCTELDGLKQRKLCEIPDEIIEAPKPVPEHLVGGNRRLAAVADCLAGLSMRESEVLYVTAKFLNPDCDTDSMPDDIRDNLCKQYGTKPATLRKIRERAIKKLKACAEPKLRAIERGE